MLSSIPTFHFPHTQLAIQWHRKLLLLISTCVYTHYSIIACCFMLWCLWWTRNKNNTLSLLRGLVNIFLVFLLKTFQLKEMIVDLLFGWTNIYEIKQQLQMIQWTHWRKSILIFCYLNLRIHFSLHKKMWYLLWYIIC